jgi:hypothetical protein
MQAVNLGLFILQITCISRHHSSLVTPLHHSSMQAVNLGLFILQIMLIDQQKKSVNDLYRSGDLGSAVMQSCQATRLMKPTCLLHATLNCT